MTNVNLQNNIRKMLEDRSMSVSELERRCGLKHSAIQNILHGRSKSPSISLIQSIAKGLGCSIEQLLSNKNISVNKIKTDLPWNPNLFITCIETFQETIEKKDIELSFEQALASATEIYQYTLNSTSKNVDKRFVEWFVELFYR